MSKRWTMENTMASRTHTTDAQGHDKTPDAVKAKPNINDVTADQMHEMHIPQMTGSRCESITHYRDNRPEKRFSSLDEVHKVPGIGPSMVEVIKEHFVCE